MLYDIVSDLIGYTGQSNIYSTVMNICGAITVLFFVMLFYFIFRILTLLFFK